MKADLLVHKTAEEIAAPVGGKVEKKRQSVKKAKSPGASGMDLKEKLEIKAYLSKLQEIVPFMPKDRKLSKVEVISYVIEYIRELRVTLGLPPCSPPDASDFAEMDLESSGPALMMSMAMMASHTGDVMTTTVTSTTNVSAAIVSPQTPSRDLVSRQQQQQQTRQPLGVIVNPINCAGGTVVQQTQVVQKPVSLS